ncbi:MAG TPA: hypothetical protein VK896_14885, partial [Gaiellaceae bacterium]|nr:hypothetical protein [Gaiellaceae bacterium]
MTDREQRPPETPGPAENAPDPAEAPRSFTDAVGAWFRTAVGGLAIPVASTVLAFLVGGLVVAATGHNPLG